MKKPFSSGQLHLLLYSKIALLLFSSFILVSGCHPGIYDTIDFCWTSEHRLAPDERFLAVNTSPQAAVGEIITWAKQKEGAILEYEDNYSYIFRLQPHSEKKFSALREIVEKHWEAYDADKYRILDHDEWTTLLQLSKSQVALVKAQEGNGYRIEIRLGNRDRTVEFEKYMGTEPYWETIRSPFATPPGIKRTYSYWTKRPVYRTVKETRSFFSLIEFFVFGDQGQTFIYAVGVPVAVVEPEPLRAAYGNWIKHYMWRGVTGKEEASLIKDAYSYLREKCN